MLTAILLLALQADPAAKPIRATSPFDHIVILNLVDDEPRLSGRGRTKRVEYTCEVAGTLHVWTSTQSDLDLFLRVERADGTLIAEDDNGSGGTTPYVRMWAKAGDRLRIAVAATRSDDELAGARSKGIELHVVAAPESEATLAGAEAAGAALQESRRLRGIQDFSAARALLSDTIDTLFAIDGGVESYSVCGRVYELANDASSLGMFDVAERAWRRCYEHCSIRLPGGHSLTQGVGLNIASMQFQRGDRMGARALQERILELCSRELSDDNNTRQLARRNLALSCLALGDVARARMLAEQALDVDSRTKHADDPSLQQSRALVASALAASGDFPGARSLEQSVLDSLSRVLPDDDPELQSARLSLASTLQELGELPAARALFEKAVERLAATHPDDHAHLQKARGGLALTLWMQGEFQQARAVFQTVLDVLLRTHPDDHPDVQVARGNLALAMRELGDLQGVRSLQEQALEELLHDPAANPRHLRMARLNLALSIADQIARASRSADGVPNFEAEQDRFAALIGEVCAEHADVARTATLAFPAREAEERCANLDAESDGLISFVLGYGVMARMPEFEAPLFVLSELTRGGALAAADVSRRAAGTPQYGALRDALHEASNTLAGLAQTGATSEEFDRARANRERIELELGQLAREISGGGAAAIEFDVEPLANQLAADAAAVGFRRFTKWRIDVVDELDATGNPTVRTTAESALFAFVVRRTTGDAATGSASSPSLTLIDLGPIAPIQSAVREWRHAVGVELDRGSAPGSNEVEAERTHGSTLRKLVFDPLLPALGNARHVIAALDDDLHLVPLDALPLSDSNEFVGDRWHIETRATLTELLSTQPEPSSDALVAIGGATFNSTPLDLAADELASIEAIPSDEVASVSRGGAWERRFAPLTHSAEEARGIGALYVEAFEGRRSSLVLENRKASRNALVELAPKARFLHVATHGWYAPESIRSWNDAEPIDKYAGLATRASGVEQVHGMSPLLLCGLALAGANLPEDAVGRLPGLITADELSTFDLSNCELAVLSACDTNVGKRRAGQGVASLQKALQMAGARSVITSLWKVPDEATKLLMLEFYRRLWVLKEPKWQALAAAKRHVRDFKDESGRPKYGLRDWAGWVLTGHPQ